MKITMEHTSKIVCIDNTVARVWRGKTDSGIEVLCFVTRIAVSDENQNPEQYLEHFKKELRKPGASDEGIESVLMELS